MIKNNQKTEKIYYESFADDLVKSKNQVFQLSENYVWIHGNGFYRMGSKCLYLLARLFSLPYCRFGLHMKTKNRSVIRKYAKIGYFLYGNHTQPIGDVFIPIRAFLFKRCYGVVSPANLGIPVLGPLLPMLGALPLADGVAAVKKLKEAIRLRIVEKSCIVFYPEAHVWPWYTGIRPFPAASFGFPAEYGVPSFCITTTYQKRKYGKKPGVTVYLDGPFYPDGSLSKKEQKKRLRDDIYNCMVWRSKNSTCEYIHYERRDDR